MAGSAQGEKFKKRVLLVEDEPLIAIALESTLKELGFDVVASATGISSALQVIGREPVECAILDVNLGSQRVDAVADALAARNCPFIFMTGYSTSDVPPGHRGRTVLQKPFRLDRLLAVLHAEFGLAAGDSRPPQEDSSSYRDRHAKTHHEPAVPAPGL
jgi:DNA-binding response OmpR family regulator